MHVTDAGIKWEILSVERLLNITTKQQASFFSLFFSPQPSSSSEDEEEEGGIKVINKWGKQVALIWINFGLRLWTLFIYNDAWAKLSLC